jgi:hypothetical protein
MECSVRIASGQDGSVTYRLDTPPEGLTAVRGRDLAAAWDAAREAARANAPGPATRFEFARPDGTATALALSDRDAACWISAVDQVAALRTPYGVSLCLRLLALVHLLAHSGWTARLLEFEAGRVRLHPALLRLAAAAPLSSEGLFDENSFHDSLATLPIHS